MYGVGLIVIGMVLLPFGIRMMKVEIKQNNELPLFRRVLVYILEFVDMLTTGSLSTWLLCISFMLILGGILLTSLL